jgi:hypothetical protein
LGWIWVYLINSRSLWDLMGKLFAIKDEKAKFYAQIESSKDVWQVLDGLANILYGESWMIDHHYRGEVKENDYFSFDKNGVHLIIIMTLKRIHLVVMGLENNQKIKDFIFDSYSF